MEQGVYHALETSTETSTAEIAHSPYAGGLSVSKSCGCKKRYERGPQSSNVGNTGEGDSSYDQAAGEAEFVPGRHEPAHIVKTVIWGCRQCDFERTVFGGQRRGVIPLQIVGLPVMEVDGFPVWVVSGIKGAAVCVELVTEDQLQIRLWVIERCYGICIIGGFQVD